MGPDIALAASARDWPDLIHRFLLDHGGGRIVGRIMSHEQALSAHYDVLLIDDVCSFLTPRLVMTLRQSGVGVVGIYAPSDGPDAQRRLHECGIFHVVGSDSTAEAFLEAVGSARVDRVELDTGGQSQGRAMTIGLSGPSGGVGITEVSIALASALARRVPTLLLDLDATWPSVAQRLDLSVHPNIRTALDHVLHEPTRLPEAIQAVGGMMVVGGRADGRRPTEFNRAELMALLEELGAVANVVVADMGPFNGVPKGLVREMHALVLVGTCDPIGVARMIRVVRDLVDSQPDVSVLVVLNKTAPRSFRRSEALSELARSLPDVPVITVPDDQSLRRASWDGRVGSGRGYRRAIGSMAELVSRSIG